jgi:ankyrin repeat protein
MPSTFGRPDLTRPVVDGSVGMVKYLLAHGADPNARLTSRILKRVYNPGDPHLGAGATPLMRAARGADAGMMRILLDGGADPTLKQKNLQSPIILAAGIHPKGGDNNPSHGTEAGAIEVVKVCLEHGMDINAVNDVDETAVFAAAGSPGMIRFLAEHGARLDVKNHRGQTPLEAALKAREVDPATVAVLRELTGAVSKRAEIEPAVKKDN